MNYYEHHLGDYTQATAHLTMLEDAAYSRMLRWYYANEKPLPLDVKMIERLVRAQTKAEKDAIKAVLSEFFIEAADGWRQDRADREIAKYRDKQAKAKRSAEARWNTSKSHSDGNANASADAMRTHTEGNAHQAPSTKHQALKPSPGEPPDLTSTGVVREEAVSAPGASPGEISGEMRKRGIQSNPADPRIIALSDQGITCETVAAACAEARDAKPDENIPTGYVIAILDRWRTEANRATTGGRARASPRSTTANEREQVSRVLTGRKAEGDGEIGSGGGRERDITGEAVRVA